MNSKSGSKPSDDFNQYISFGRLAYEALPEMWGFQLLASLLLLIPSTVILRIIRFISDSSGTALTTANMQDFILSWRMPVLLVLGTVLVLWYFVVEIAAQIYLCDDILKGRKGGVFREIKRSAASMRRFLTPNGVLIILYILIAVPLCGIGASITLTKSFYIPNFITDVIFASPLYSAAYAGFLLILAWIGFRSIFCIHGILLDELKPGEARRESSVTVGAHLFPIIRKVIGVALAIGLVIVVSLLLLNILPGSAVETYGQDLPRGQRIVLVEEIDHLTDTQMQLLVYRFMASFAVLLGRYLYYMVTRLCSSYFLLWFTRLYYDLTQRQETSWLKRPKRTAYRWMVLLMVLVTLAVFVSSAAIGLFYDQIIVREKPVAVVAHRTGGDLASENSVEGLMAAIENKCYGSETDVQRTRDGHYVINHDDTFKRLTGVNKKPSELTMDEIMKLRIRDTTGNGNELPVITIEDLLRVSKDKIKLFVELKGATADRKMVDDLVKIIRDMDCVDDVVLISLKYDVINYAETNYPEFETGTLFFAGVGDITLLNCDLLIMEEEMSTTDRVMDAHLAGKDVFVWTVNSKEMMYKFFDSDIDGIITDKIKMAEDTQKEMDERSEYMVLTDKFTGLFK